MEILGRNTQVEQELLKRLRQKYMTEKPHPHLTELIYCLTRAYWERGVEAGDKLEPTDEEVVLFAIGFGLEEVLLQDSDHPSRESLQLDGVWLTPDYFALYGDGVDLKTTRMHPDADGSPKRGVPESWQKQFMGYAKAAGVTRWTAAIVYLIQAEVAALAMQWTEEEIEENWNWVKMRRDIYQAYVRQKRVPTPFTYNEEWECKNCRYIARCRQMAVEKEGV